jgi:hypothetical protein
MIFVQLRVLSRNVLIFHDKREVHLINLIMPEHADISGAVVNVEPYHSPIQVRRAEEVSKANVGAQGSFKSWIFHVHIIPHLHSIHPF